VSVPVAACQAPVDGGRHQMHGGADGSGVIGTQCPNSQGTSHPTLDAGDTQGGGGGVGGGGGGGTPVRYEQTVRGPDPAAAPVGV
jgi:hypothetical protein